MPELEKNKAILEIFTKSTQKLLKSQKKENQLSIKNTEQLILRILCQ